MFTIMTVVVALGFLNPVCFAAHQAINAYQHALYMIWSDWWSGAKVDLYVFGTSDQYQKRYHYQPLGNVAKTKHDEYHELGYSGKALQSDVFDKPGVLEQVWTDEGSGAFWDVAFYRPLCRNGYVSLGDVAVRSHKILPKFSDAACVRDVYVLEGEWEFVWNDKGSGAKKDVSVYTAVAKDGTSGRGIRAMSTVAHHGPMDRPAYVLNSYYVDFDY